jgi:hypothetical protein
VHRGIKESRKKLITIHRISRNLFIKKRGARMKMGITLKLIKTDITMAAILG